MREYTKRGKEKSKEKKYQQMFVFLYVYSRILLIVVVFFLAKWMKISERAIITLYFVVFFLLQYAIYVHKTALIFISFSFFMPFVYFSSNRFLII